ncbi:uncharacterized protein LOC143707223 [Siphateles boraxobius]|uniref:uncharacterized protein LOC143707223 n=1 Tax=Siphateles boraxobius TaxID=180520 RepID=UPI004062F885
MASGAGGVSSSPLRRNLLPSSSHDLKEEECLALKTPSVYCSLIACPLDVFMQGVFVWSMEMEVAINVATESQSKHKDIGVWALDYQVTAVFGCMDRVQYHSGVCLLLTCL